MNQKKISSLRAFRFRRFANKAYSAFNSMHKVVNIGVLAGCVLTFAHQANASAQNSQTIEHVTETSEKELDEVTVTASRVELNANLAARLVTVITKQEIDRAPIQSIQDLLSYAANIDVVQRGGHGIQSDISIRGGSFDQTAILLNGINLSSPHTGHYSFDIPVNLSDIERIEIIHGPSSLTYGASAFAGGINIITKKTSDYKAYARLEAGANNLFGAEAKGILKNSIITSQLSASYKSSDGYRQNSDYNIVNMLWQNSLNIEKSKIDIQLGYNDKKFGANTFYTPAYPNQYDETQTYLFSVSGESGNKLKFIPKIYWTRHDDLFQLVRGNSSEIPYNYHRADVYGANLNIQYQSVIGITSFGSEFRNEGILSSVLGKTMENSKGQYTKSDDRTNISFALEHNILLKKVTISVGILANYNTALKDDFKLYPAINASYRLLDNFKIYTSWNKSMRMPTFTDLYYNTKTHSGNPNLSPEKSEAIELGLKYANHWFRANTSVYYMEGHNLIDWVKENPESKWQSINKAKVYKTGIEANTKFYPYYIAQLLPRETSFEIGYTRIFQNSRENSGEVSSNYLQNYLRDKLTIQANIPIYKGFSLFGAFRWQNRMGSFIKYNDGKAGNKVGYKPYSTLDLKLNWKINKLQINLSANNVYNTHYYDLGNIPQAGFWLSGGADYFF